jgi:glycosyltransferase involved in cell wall biosynthesis
MLQVSVVMPILNERKHIFEALNSLVHQDFPSDQFEILCVDGMSDDGTRLILESYSQRFSSIKILDNPQRSTACALNIGIRASTAKFIIRVDAHSKYPSNYLSSLVEAMAALPAANVGGVCKIGTMEKNGQTYAVESVLTSRFGVGNSLFRVGVADVCEVDTVPFGCYHRNLFDSIGFFDERLYRTEDYEFNQRLRRAGGRIFLIPSINIEYFPPQKLRDFFQKQFRNGFGVIESGLIYGKLASFSYRHYVPTFFVLYLFLLPFLLLIHVLFLAPLLLYFTLNLSLAAKQVRKQKRVAPLIWIPFAFIGTHISHGLGGTVGFWKFARSLIQRSR